MSPHPLRLAILWHQHQPSYRSGDLYLLPWTRLHATKDYVDIGSILASFPAIRQTINVVPSLLDQLVDYANHGATDRVLQLTTRPATELTEAEKIEILRSFFLCNVQRMVLPYPRYRELYERGHADREDLDRLRANAATFSTADWLDLQTWYTLTWIGEESRPREPFRSLLAKGAGFTEEEKMALVEASLGIVSEVIPTYRRLLEAGQAELSVTPYYHPILPILCDSYAALEAMPQSDLPVHHIAWPEDARWQIAAAVASYQHHFGREPAGMWPSEGSVSDEAIRIIRSEGLTWAASDEMVLRRTLGENWNPLAKYFPWTFKTPSGPLRMVFRDHELSDAIGFVYSSWEPAAAALDFYNRLVEIRSRIVQERRTSALDEALVSVILDGENCWEYYQENGRPFLRELYRLLSESTEITTTTIGDALATTPDPSSRTLGRIYAGSWIGSSFRIWIGHAEDNTAWDALASARELLLSRRDAIDGELFERGMREIYIAEGSDWFWWYGDENSAVNEDDFDELFREHLANVYRLLGERVPEVLLRPIRHAAHRSAIVPPSGSIAPTIDGRHSSDAEWQGSGWFTVERVGGAMHHANVVERRIYFGSGDGTLFLRYDAELPLSNGTSVRLTVAGHRHIAVTFAEGSVSVEAGADERGRIELGGVRAAVGETLEIAIGLEQLAREGHLLEEIGIICETFEKGHPTERFPQQGAVLCPLVPNA